MEEIPELVERARMGDLDAFGLLVERTAAMVRSVVRGVWSEVGGLARFQDETVRALGHDPSRVRAVGVGLGLERIAGLRIGTDDVRRVSIAGAEA